MPSGLGFGGFDGEGLYAKRAIPNDITVSGSPKTPPSDSPAVIVVGRHNFESLFARSEEFPSGAANASWFATRISVILNILNSLAAATVVEFHLLNSTTRSNDFLIVVRSCRIHLRSTITLSPSDPLSPKQYYYRENWAESLAKRNHEFESNPLRQPVSPFLCLGGVLPENSILRPKTREYHMDKHLT